MLRKRLFWISVFFMLLNLSFVFARSDFGDQGARNIIKIFSSPWWNTLLFLILFWLFVSFLIMYFFYGRRGNTDKSSKMISFSGGAIVTFALFIINSLSGLSLVERVQQFSGVISFLVALMIAILIGYFAYKNMGSVRGKGIISFILAAIVFFGTISISLGLSGWWTLIIILIILIVLPLLFGGLAIFLIKKKGKTIRKSLSKTKNELYDFFPREQDKDYIRVLFEEIDNEVKDIMNAPSGLDSLKNYVNLKATKLRIAVDALSGRGNSQGLMEESAEFLGPSLRRLGVTLSGILGKERLILEKVERLVHPKADIKKGIAPIINNLYRLAGEEKRFTDKNPRKYAKQLEKFDEYWETGSSEIIANFKIAEAEIKKQEKHNPQNAMVFMESEETIKEFFSSVITQGAAINNLDDAVRSMLDSLAGLKADVEKGNTGSDDEEIADVSEDWFEHVGT